MTQSLPTDVDLRFAQAVTPALTPSQALLEAERCLYCHDAPCTTACPTGIDVPSFIRRIGEGNLRGAARQILEANPLGGTCARVCPTETLCEQVCVRNTQTGVPVPIGQLQRYAVDALMSSPRPQLFTRAAPTGRRVAVVGAGPAGLACAHTLARLGHSVTIFDARPKAGGLNEYGLASYKMPGDFAQQELQWLLDIGGIEIRHGHRVDNATELLALRESHDALFLGIGLGSTRRLDIPGETLTGVEDAVDFIARLRQAPDKARVPVGRQVVVIGGGMTAVDAAVQSRLLGAESVTMVYRRGPEHMSASLLEQEWALKHGVVILHGLAPQEVLADGDRVSGVRFARSADASGAAVVLPADSVLKAIGQTLGADWLTLAGLQLDGARLGTDDAGRTSVPGIWAGGDCRADGEDLTVQAVAHGRDAARDMHRQLCPDAA